MTRAQASTAIKFGYDSCSTRNYDIESKIYIIRGQRVMLDEDLAELYLVQTMRLNEQVKRNLRRFPEDFMFRLSDEEFQVLISQIAISKKGRGGRRKPPYAFTEQGVAMLSAVLHSERAIDVNVGIMPGFLLTRLGSELRNVLRSRILHAVKGAITFFRSTSSAFFLILTVTFGLADNGARIG